MSLFLEEWLVIQYRASNGILLYHQCSRLFKEFWMSHMIVSNLKLFLGTFLKTCQCISLVGILSWLQAVGVSTRFWMGSECNYNM